MTVLIPYESRELPLVSIVTPTYNQAQFLAEAIDSVLAQDYPRLEYIVIDDGSTDDTANVMSRYSSRARCERIANIGQAAALNKAWRMCNGTILGYLSSDDRLRSGAVTSLVNMLLGDKRVGVAYGDYRLIDTHGRTLRELQTPEYDAHELQVNLVCQPGPGALFLRSMYEAVDGWDSNLRQVPDFDFWLRVSRITTFIRLASVVADCRVHEESASFRKISQSRSDEIVQVIDRFWGDSNTVDSRHSRAKSLLTSSRNHLGSGRIFTGLRKAMRALRYYPPLFLEYRTWRTLVKGVARRYVYRLLAKFR